ncbi:MAG: 1-acyl-sn-glycerol-3-phosphate acyltransferase [Deltaproteobacteria bacterium]|nr:1-acyl-sn-glycerol-3-phosphate acyltransferase [Deltaproteobacteria bacterium]
MFLRTLAVWALGIPVTMVFCFIIFLSALADRTGSAAHTAAAIWCRVVLFLAGVKVSVEGVEKIPRGAPVLFLSNHQGAFDIPALQSSVPAQFRWVAKKSLFKIPLIGWSMYLSGYIGVKRESATESYKSMEKAAAKIRGGTSVMIFPEGTRSDTGELLPMKRGAFVLASRSGAPIVPIAINGTKDILKRGGFWIRPCRVTIRIGDPIPTEGVEEKELRPKTRETIAKMLSGMK